MDWLPFWLGATAHSLTDALSWFFGLVVGMTVPRGRWLVPAALVAGIVYRAVVFAVNSEARSEPFWTLQVWSAAGAALIIGSVVFLVRRRRLRSKPHSNSTMT